MDNVLFSPVMCSSKTFEQQAPYDGQVYFVTDTKQLHVVRDGKFIELCGGINLVYGKKEIAYSNSGKEPDPNVLFFYSDLEDKDNPPLVNDLILNKDGCFYRVKSITSTGIQTERLTLQGTGSGGSGSGSSGSSSTSYYLDASGDYVYPSTAEEMNISFRAIYDGEKLNYIKRVTLTLEGETQPFYSKSGLYLEMSENKTHYIDLYPYRKKFGSNAKTVTIKTTDNYGNERDEILTVTIVTLQLKSTFSDITAISWDNFNYTYTFDGANNLDERYMVWEFYGEESSEKPVHQVETTAKVGSNQSYNISLAGKLSAGAYTLKVYGYGPVGGQDLKSNILTHTIVYFPEDSKGSILGVLIPDKIEQYTDAAFKFVIMSEDSDEQSVSMSVNNVLYDTIKIAPKTQGEFSYYFETANDYTISFETSSGLSKSFTITVEPYESELPIIDPSDNNLLLYLTPRGHSNDSINRDIWTDSSLTGAAAHNQGTGNLSGFYYGNANGWLKDEDDTPCLKLTSGATFELPDFMPFAYDPTQEPESSDWQAAKMGQGMTIELDFEISGVTDYSENIIECISKTQTSVPQVGFRMNGKTVELLSQNYNGTGVTEDKDGNPIDNTVLPQTIVEDKRTRVSYVIEPYSTANPYPMCLMYLNGIQSGAMFYASDDRFRQNDNRPGTLKIMSSSAQVKIYGIRIYASALGDDLILRNYTASLSTLDERQTKYDDTNIFNALTGEIDYEAVSAESYDLKIPYMLLTGGYPTESLTDKYQLKTNVSSSDIHLPTSKKDYRLVDIEIHYPDTDYFKTGLGAGLAGEVKKFKNEFENGLFMKDNLGKAPTKGGYIMYGQGTSSMEYPVKNLRLRANKKNGADQFVVRPAIGDVEIVCMKADYMESSGSHNTGTGNFVDDCYKALGLQTPGQKHYDAEKTGKIVTCIKGYPCIIFWRPDEDSEYEFVGKYNLNLDKATSDPFGFKHDDSDFGYLPAGYQYTDENDQIQTAEEREVNSIHCFEFLDNAVNVCNFEPEDGKSYQETWYGPHEIDGEEDQPGWTIGFESRYPEDLVGKHDADSLWDLANWIYALQEQRKLDEENMLTPDMVEIDATYELANATFSSSVQYYESHDDGSFTPIFLNAERFDNNKDEKYYIMISSVTTFKMKSLQEFKDHYEEYFNKDFLLMYYVLTEVLLMVDSRVKNMMLATWGPEKIEGTDEYTKNHIFYPIFYDMDTILGLDNAGYEKFSYYTTDDSADVYNGKDVLWNFVRDALGKEISIMYNKLATTGMLDSSKILDYYNKDQANMANEAFYNGDANYKYIQPALIAKEDASDDKAGTYLYAGQGDRSLTREYFINNRVPFLHGRHETSTFTSTQRINFRWYYPTETTLDDKLKVSIQAVPPNGDFNFTSMQTCYAGVQLGANTTGLESYKFTNKEEHTITISNAENANGTEAYLLGVNNLSDLGDLSSKYVQKFLFDKASNIKLERLVLGSGRQGYNNTYWGNSDGVLLTGCTYLKHFDLRNCEYFKNAISFEPCPAIERILLTGSEPSSVILPENGNLQELRLPPSIKTLNIVSHPNLTKFSMGTYKYKTSDVTEDMTDESCYEPDYTTLQEVNIVDTPIDTYEILCNAPALSKFNVQGFNWNITKSNSQYTVTSDTSAQSGKSYWVWENGGYKEYQGVWPEGIDQGGVMEEVKMLDEDGVIVQIPLLERLISLQKSSADKLSGTITIDIPGAKVNEYAIYSKYHSSLPNVTIKYGTGVEVKEAFKLKFYNLDNFPTKAQIESGEYNTFYEVPCDSESATEKKKLSWLVSAEGPNGKALSTPTKMSSATEVFTHTGKWIMKKLDDNYDSASGEEISIDDRVIDGSYVFIPVYQANTRMYSVTFHDCDGKFLNIRSILSGLESSQYVDGVAPPTDGIVKYTYQQVYSTHIYTPMAASKPDDDLAETERWQFRGWISEGDYNTYKNQGTLVNPKYYDMTKEQAEIDGLQLYPYFEKEDCLTDASPSEWFEIESANSFTIGCSTYNSSQNKVQDSNIDFTYSTGKEILFSGLYLPWIQGKVTIPSTITDSSGKLVTVECFGGRGRSYTGQRYNPKITQAYFLANSQCKYLSSHAFFSCNKLKTVVLPKNLVVIGNDAFSSTPLTKLENYSDNDNIKYIGANAFTNSAAPAELPVNLVGLGNSAFYSTSFFDNAYLTSIPIGVTTLGTQVFALTKCNIWTLGHEQDGNLNGEENNLEYIGSGAFAQCQRSGSNNVLEIKKSIKFLTEHKEYTRQDKDPESGAITETVIIDPYGPFYESFRDQTFSIYNYSGIAIEDQSDFTTKYAGGILGANAVISSFNEMPS